MLDTAILYDKYKTDQIKKAILIGSCNGEISSERAKCRIETLSVVNNQGDIIEKKGGRLIDRRRRTFWN
uniref:hypothetical protein n=1 Tax=Orientia tsutsugamushi TaxID=784 RepID=UPI0013A599F9|nr:hypothetical protein [Orientia tsutsugamushi]